MTTDEELREDRGAVDVEQEMGLVADDSEESSSGGLRRSMLWLQVIAFLLGLALLVYVINRVGVQPIFDAWAGSASASSCCWRSAARATSCERSP